MRTTLLAVAVVAVAAPLVTLARPAAACEPPPCWPGAFLPGEGATIPANTPGFEWHPMFALDPMPVDDPANLAIYHEGEVDPIPFTMTALPDGDILLVPDAPLVENTSYYLTDTNHCIDGSTGPTATVHVVAA